MHVSEMRRREAFSATLVETLARGWSLEFGMPFSVVPEARAGQAWSERRPFSAFTVTRASRNCRVFLRDSFRNTPVRWRRPAQWLLGTFAAGPVGLRVGGGEVFSVKPGLPGARERLVLPGNLRIRVFDFAAGVVRVLAKVGFPKDKFIREIEVRCGDTKGPFPKIRKHDVEAGWFEESILDAIALPRLSPRIDRMEILGRAIEAVQEWGKPSRENMEAADWANKLEEDLQNLLTAISERYGGLPCNDTIAHARVLTGRAAALGRIQTVVGHGDLQPGNILVGRDGASVWVTDWENSARRFDGYDRLVLNLGSRSPRALAERVARFVGDDGFCAGEIAMMILEDLKWYAQECMSGPFRILSMGFVQYCRELPALLKVLSDRGQRISL